MKTPGDHTPQRDRLSRDSGLDEQPITPVPVDKDKRVHLHHSNTPTKERFIQVGVTCMCTLCLGA